MSLGQFFAYAAVTYLSIGFAKWVLDMSRIRFLHKLVVYIDKVRSLQENQPESSRFTLFLVIAVGMSVQTLLFWPEIVWKEGLKNFLQPISSQRACEIFGSAAGVHIKLASED